MLRRILLATDLSPYAAAVVDCVAGLRDVGVRDVVLLHVVDQALGYVQGAAGFDVIGQLRLDAERSLRDEAGRLEAEGFAVRTRLEVGVPAREIVRVAEEERVDLIVVGAYGRTRWVEALLGSVTERVLHAARRPVLVERPKVLAELDRVECRCRGERTFERVLMPTDFSPASAVAQGFLGRLRDTSLKDVIVLHVVAEPESRGGRVRGADQTLREAQALLDGVVDDMVREGLPARHRLEQGVPADTILRVAEEEGVGSIVMGSRGRGMVAELLLGSVAERVARRSERPVVIVPARGRRGSRWANRARGTGHKAQG